MTAVYKIRLNGPNAIFFDDDVDADDGINFQTHITRDIFNDRSNVVIGNKKSYLLHHGPDYQMMGYMHSLTFAIDVVRSRIATHLDAGKKYEIHVKRMKENNANVIKIYLYVASPGWIYNGLTLVNKFKITEVPKVELKYVLNE
jgi:hypothetical protein